MSIIDPLSPVVGTLISLHSLHNPSSETLVALAPVPRTRTAPPHRPERTKLTKN